MNGDYEVVFLEDIYVLGKPMGTFGLVHKHFVECCREHVGGFRPCISVFEPDSAVGYGPCQLK